MLILGSIQREEMINGLNSLGWFLIFGGAGHVLNPNVHTCLLAHLERAKAAHDSLHRTLQTI